MLFLSISSVSTERSLWWYRQNFLLQTVFLRLTCPCRVNCCENTSRNSQNVLKIRNYSNYALTLVSWRILENDNSSSPLKKKKDLMICRHYVERTHYLKIRVDSWKHENRHSLGCEGLFSSRTLLYWYHHWIKISRRNSFLVSCRERNQEYVTGTSEEIPVESIELVRAGKPVAKVKPQPKPAVTLSPVSLPIRERKWIDINPETFNEGCCAVSKFMIRLLRHEETIPREDHGAARFDDLIEKFKVKFVGNSERTVDSWTTFLAKGGGPKKMFQYCVNLNSSKHILYFRAIQWHSGDNLVDPALQDNVLLPDDFGENISHIGNANEMHSIIQGGLIPGGRSVRKDRQASVLYSRKPDLRKRRSGRSLVRSWQTQNRSVQEHLEISPKYSFVVQFEARSKKKGCSSIKLARNRSFQHTTCDLF